MRASRRKRSADMKRLQGEAYCEMLFRIQEWSERRKLPLKSVLMTILVPWAKRRGIKVPKLTEFSLEDQG